MVYDYKQLNNGRWGIFINGELVATIGCANTCQKIVQFLESRFGRQNAIESFDSQGQERKLLQSSLTGLSHYDKANGKMSRSDRAQESVRQIDQTAPYKTDYVESREIASRRAIATSQYFQDLNLKP
ncbi:MAG: hypothetical protein AAFQ80_03320 [Cyanobacteria bacterium J06621_8]